MPGKKKKSPPNGSGNNAKGSNEKSSGQVAKKTTMVTSSAAGSGMALPAVVRDPRFRAARRLVQQGQVSTGGAVDMFASLLEESRQSHGVDNIESAAAYYEYGNAILRQQQQQQQQRHEDENDESLEEQKVATTSAAVNSQRNAAAAAAERRAGNVKQDETAPVTIPSTVNGNDKDGKPFAASKEEEDGDMKPAAKEEKGGGDNGPPEADGDSKTAPTVESSAAVETNDDIEQEKVEDDAVDDLELALDMMETAWSILDRYVQNENGQEGIYHDWAADQLPRVLTGIGDVLSSVDRHADAADAYSRALGHRQAALEQFQAADEGRGAEQSTDFLSCRRKIVEANILIAEEFLACPEGRDVVTTESRDVLVKAAERVDYARGYYDKARDELQETVLLMGQMAAAGINIEQEKEDVCFAATMVMGTGTTLAEIDERAEQEKALSPAKKKVKRT